MSDSTPAGVTKFSFAGKKVAKLQPPPPVAPGEYTFSVMPDDIEVKTAAANESRPNPVPYVSYSIRLHNTPMKEGGKDRRLYCMALLGLNPGKDGVLNFERPNGLLALSLAVGMELPEVSVEERATADGTGTVKFFNPKEVEAWIKSIVGIEGQVAIKVESQKTPGEDQPTSRNVVGRFISRS